MLAYKFSFIQAFHFLILNANSDKFLTYLGHKI